MTSGTDRSGRQRLLGWVRTHPGLVVLLVAPFVVFGLPQLGGRVFLDGDNFLQNFPLRALVGHDLHHGLLPLWNPYLFSGTPLLGGFNAGAGYPTTWLMAVLPLTTAWTLNMAVAYDLAVVGMYLFLRRQPLGSTAATFGAATFAFAGYMSGQIVHIDLIEGAAWLPWTLLAVHQLTGPVPDEGAAADRSGGPHSVRAWVALLAVTVGLAILTGGAEAIIDSAVLVGIYWVARLITSGRVARTGLRSLASSVASVLTGVTLGVALGAAQWVPGLAFQSQSQRASISYGFFATGSLPTRVLPLLASPFVLGTNQDQPGYYAGPYNFPEVTGYVGILALIAGCTLLIRRWRRRPEARHWLVWYVVLGVGLLSALGTQTPFGHVLYLLPLIKNERLLNRNLLLVDFALASLLAWWIHLLLADREAGGAAEPLPLRRQWRPGHRAELFATCTPLAVIAALCIFLWAGGPVLDRLLGAQFPIDASTRYAVAGLVTVGACIAAAATWVVLFEQRFAPRRLRRLLAAIILADLVFFNAMVVRPPISQTLAQAQQRAATSFASLVGNGRFVVYDPDQFYSDQLHALGQTDLNVFNDLSSAQGYTALTGGAYYDATGAHYQEDLNPATLAAPIWDELNVSTLLSLPSYFLTQAGSSPGGTSSTPFPPLVPRYNGAPAADTGPVTLAAGRSHRWYLGGPLTLDGWSFPVLSGSANGTRVGLLTTTGQVRWLATTAVTTTGPASARTLDVSTGAPVRASGVVVENDSAAPAVVGIPTARTAEAGTVALDGPMQYGVDWPHWRYAGTFGSFGVFTNNAARGWAWASTPAGGAPARGTSVATVAPAIDGRQQITVHATGPVELVRSVTWSPGWRATVRAVGAATSRSATVHPNGVIQMVDLPAAGDYVVTFDYSPGTARAGIAASLVTAGGLALWGAVELLGRARRRRSLAGAARRRPPVELRPE